MDKIKLWYTDMWSDFKCESKSNYFTKLLSERYDVEITPKNPDLLIYSVFGNDNIKWNKTKNIFFTGENKQPYGNYKLAFTFNYDETSTQLRLPLYSYFCYEENLLDKMIFNRKTLGQNFCSFMVGNLYHGEGSKLRVEFFHKLSQYKKVLSSGRSLRNVDYSYLEDAHGVDNWRNMKYEILKIEQPKFMISFENQSTIGYTTEKIMDCMLMGIVPIYWGNEDVYRDFNPESFIHVNKFKSLDDVVDYVKYLDNTPIEYNKILEKSWLTTDEHYKYFDSQRILDNLSNVIEHKTNSVVNINLNKTPQTVNDVFDGVYCLNLNRRPDRWQKVQERFNREHIHVKRIEAIDKNDTVISNEYNKFKSIGKANHLSNIGSYAILKSFHKILTDAKKSKYDKILIFEDDILFHKDFKYLFDLHYSNIPKNWNIWYLGGTQQPVRNNINIKYENMFFHHAYNMDGCFAIAIKNNMFDILLQYMEEIDYPLDSAIKEKLQPYRGDIYASTPFIIGHDFGPSDNWETNFTEDLVKTTWKGRYYDTKIYV